MFMFDVLISAPFEFASPLSSRRQGSSTPVSANPSQFCRLIVYCQPSHVTGGDAVFEMCDVRLRVESTSAKSRVPNIAARASAHTAFSEKEIQNSMLRPRRRARTFRRVVAES